MISPSSVVIVGASAAGLAAAETLRREGYDRTIFMVGDEPHLPYDRPPLSKHYLSGARSAEELALRSRDQVAALDVVMILGDRAVGLDRDRCQVRLASGRALSYDAAVIATGVVPRRLQAAEGLSGVHTLHTLDDAAALREELDGATRVAVVGAGFLGSEIAAAAYQLGREVTLVDPAAVPMLRQFGPMIGAAVAELHASKGVNLRLGVQVADFRSSSGRVTGIELSDGSLVAADVVVVAIGSEPTTDWLRGADLSLSNGVDCDVHSMAAPQIYAAGDIASFPHPSYGTRMRIEHRMNATEQGTNAAQNLLGAHKPFNPLPYFWSDQYDVKMQAYGIFPADAEVEFASGRPEDGRFVATFVHKGKTVGALGWNAIKDIRRFRQKIIDDVFAVTVLPSS